MGSTLPETNSLPLKIGLKIGLPDRKVVFQQSIFRSELLVPGRYMGVSKNMGKPPNHPF